MSLRHIQLTGSHVNTAHAALKAALHSRTSEIVRPAGGGPMRAFVTVSRQPGAGAIQFSHLLARRLNQNGAADWTAWDQELIDKVCCEHGLDRTVLDLMERRPHNWLSDLVQNFAGSDTTPDAIELRGYKRIMTTVRALAQAGHAIIVGRGGVFITQGLAGGIHIRLVAPLEHRIRYMAEAQKLSLHEAAGRVQELERNRAAFFERYWPGKVSCPESFTLTLNAGELSLEEMVECALPLIHGREGAYAPVAKTMETGHAGRTS